MAEGGSWQVERTREFQRWFARLRDAQAQLAIERRIRRMELGNFGDVKTVGDSVSELRIDQGPGYRVYFTQIGGVVVVLLCGGDKSSQSRDIEAAKVLAAKARTFRP